MQDAFEELTEKKVSVFGVSTNDVATQLKFSKKEKLNYTLVADKNKQVAKAFKVPLIMNMMASRRAFLFKDGVLVWRDVKGATKTQGAEVLQAIKENKRTDEQKEQLVSLPASIEELGIDRSVNEQGLTITGMLESLDVKHIDDIFAAGFLLLAGFSKEHKDGQSLLWLAHHALCYLLIKQESHLQQMA